MAMDQMTAPVTSGRKPRGQGASRRGEILDAAKHLFAADGVSHVTMRRIGAAVGVSPTALYMHFADKDAILSAIAQDTFTELLDRLKHSSNQADAPLLRLRAGLRAYIEFGQQRPDEYRLTFMTRQFSRSTAKGCGLQMADQSFAILQDRVIELMRDGVFRQGQPARVAELIWATLHGVTALLLDHAQNLDTPPSALVEGALDVLLAGLTAPAHQNFST
jgi:AcrR family transcriptional regulator